MREKYTRWGLQHYTLAPYHPETNSLSESIIGTIKRIMEKLAGGGCTEQREYLGLATVAYRLMPHSYTGFSHFKILYGHKATKLMGIRTAKLTPISNIGMLFKNMPKKWINCSPQLTQKHKRCATFMQPSTFLRWARAVTNCSGVGNHMDWPASSRAPRLLGAAEVVWINPCCSQETRTKLHPAWVRIATGEFIKRFHPAFMKPFRG